MGILLIVCTFMRVYYIVIGILYLLFIFPINFLPCCCCCQHWIRGDDIIMEIWRMLEANEWNYSELAMSHTKQKASCLLCMQEFQQGQLLMLLPCQSQTRDSGRFSEKKSSTFGDNNSFLTGQCNDQQDVPENFFHIDYSHNMHKSCLEDWLWKNGIECPVCRTELDPQLFETQNNLQNRAGKEFGNAGIQSRPSQDSEEAQRLFSSNR